MQIKNNNLTYSLIFFALIFILIASYSSRDYYQNSVATTPAKIDIYKQFPISFEANQGQYSNHIDFLFRSQFYRLFLTPTEVIMGLSNPKHEAKADNQSGASIRMRFLNANQNAKGLAFEPLASKRHYLIGQDPSLWRTNIPTYSKVRYEQIYPGIDVIYYGNTGQLEYDFIVAPGADPEQIKLAFTGSKGLDINTNGDLLIHTGKKTVRQHKPVIYQQVNGVRKPVQGHYVVADNQTVGFKISAYNTALPLIIDPVLSFSSYIGGEFFDTGRRIVTDQNGNIYLTGWSFSSDLNVTSGALQSTHSDTADAFIAKLSSDGTTLEYMTYFGGSGNDQGRDIALDDSGNIYVTGGTDSTDLPIQGQNMGKSDAFIIKLSADGSLLLASTYVGGSEDDVAHGIAVSNDGLVYITGETLSYDFPTNHAYDTSCGEIAVCNSSASNYDAFVAVFEIDQGNMLSKYSTFIGGGENDISRAIAIDQSGIAYITGETNSVDFPDKNAYQDMLKGGFDGGYDAFIAKIDPGLSGENSLLYASFLGGEDEDNGTDITIDSNAMVYICGRTSSRNYPTSDDAFQRAFQGGDANGFVSDAFITVLDTNPQSSVALQYSSYLGGELDDSANALAFDPADNLYIAGVTDSTSFPVVNAFQYSIGGGKDVFIIKLDTSTKQLVYSTYMGSSLDDWAYGLSLDPEGNIVLAGETESTNLASSSAEQTTFGGYTDAFVAKIDNSQDIDPPGGDTGGGMNNDEQNNNSGTPEGDNTTGGNGSEMDTNANTPANNSGGGGGAISWLLVLAALFSIPLRKRHSYL